MTVNLGRVAIDLDKFKKFLEYLKTVQGPAPIPRNVKAFADVFSESGYPVNVFAENDTPELRAYWSHGFTRGVEFATQQLLNHSDEN